MKIKTITCHNVYNYGATLQAYALQFFLESKGHEVEIIDYYPKYRHKRNFWKIPNNSNVYKYTSKFFIIHLLYAAHRCIKYFRDTNFERNRKFDDFDRKYLHLTKTKYKSYLQLQNDPPSSDIYIAGSDQIWNPNGDTGRDPAFYLQFGRDTTKRISYAASFGVSKIDSKDISLIADYLQCFDAISVREKIGLNILSELGYEDAIQVVDPVFLLSKEKWMQLASASAVNGDYILVYDFFQDDVNIKTMAIKLAQEKKCSIVAVNDGGKCKYADINIGNASPSQFISLIAHASVMVSNSFHATAFSLILNTEFYTYPVQRNRNQSRMVDLLSSVGLEYRFNATYVFTKENINWDSVNEHLSILISSSKNYLRTIEDHTKDCYCSENLHGGTSD